MCKDLPKITVIVPVYNVQAYLKECLDSLRNQTYKNLEILLVDDGSPDCSGKICDEFVNRDSRFKVFHIENQGLGRARNYALKHVSGDYVGFVDSDDKCELTMFQTLISSALKYDADITFGAKVEWYQNHVRRWKCLDDSDFLISQREFFKAILSLGRWRQAGVSGGYVWLKLFKRQLIDGLEFVDTKFFIEDELFCAAAGLRAKRICCVDKELYYYRQRNGSIVRDYVSVIKGLKGRLLVGQLIGQQPQRHELSDICEDAIVNSLVSAAKRWGDDLCEDDKKLLTETAKRILPVAKKRGSFKEAWYTTILTRSDWIKDYYFSARKRITRKRKRFNLFD